MVSVVVGVDLVGLIVMMGFFLNTEKSWLGIVNHSIINHRKTFDGWSWNWRWNNNWNYCFLSFANRSDKASVPTIRVTVELNSSKFIHTTVGLGCVKIYREVAVNSKTLTK